MSENTTSEFRHLGRRSGGPSKELDTFPSPDHVTCVRFESDELTSLCPVTGQPDFNRVVIEYRPAGRCVESKSLKLYLWSFRDQRVFAETLADIIAGDLFAAVSPSYCRVTLTQSVRGGLALTATAERSA